MGIFEKHNESGHSSSPSSLSDQLNMVGAGTTFEGTLEAESDVRISGTLIGMLNVSGRVLIAEDGVVEGDLEAQDADIAGSMQGTVKVAGRLMLKGTARVEGEIHTDRLIVEEGAHFSGRCHMGGDVEIQQHSDHQELDQPEKNGSAEEIDTVEPEVEAGS